MTGFLYYFPGKTAVTTEDITAAGLGYAFRRSGRTPNSLRQGPDGGQGVILTDAGRVDPGRNKYDHANQAWEQHKAGGYWVGIYTDDRPTPEALERSPMLPGTKIELGDGNEWQVPMARQWSMEDDPTVWANADVFPRWVNRLPQYVRFDTDAGASVSLSAVEPRYAELWAVCQADMRLRYGTPEAGDEEALRGASLYLNTLRILQMNYAIGAVEANLLGLILTGAPQKIFDALGDWATWEELNEKKTSALAAVQSSSSGQEETPLNTDQP